MYSHAASVLQDRPRNSGNAVRVGPKTKRRTRPGIRHAESSPYVRRTLAVPYDTASVAVSPIRRPVREPLETDGPATCLI